MDNPVLYVSPARCMSQQCCYGVTCTDVAVAVLGSLPLPGKALHTGWTMVYIRVPCPTPASGSEE